ncbi:S8 family serine peptidase [Paenibacillus paeoniae]|uniref:Peptidase S8 n=1 Tax=Paenibacillus paeoniae TaxID=2292705 RepID=A0A371P0R4_9BACL|nr:S8 family serine peptidase [Paenibacillus paeoniae]REK69532.1 peptidase S8 [Paenibacillus paeoniae]
MNIDYKQAAQKEQNQRRTASACHNEGAFLVRLRSRAKRLVRGRGADSLALLTRKGLRGAFMALLLGSIALWGLSAPGAPAPGGSSPAGYAEAAGSAALAEQPQSWLLKWSDPELAHELSGVEVIRRQSEAAVDLVRPAGEAGGDLDEWLRDLRSAPGVEYVHPNDKVQVLSNLDDNNRMNSLTASDRIGAEAEEDDADQQEEQRLLTTGIDESSTDNNDTIGSSSLSTESPTGADQQAVSKAVSFKANDPELSKQKHLVQIGALKAWETIREQTEITIALVDTGVDLDHPDLKDNLVAGTNLVDPKKLPDDDNGHGTSVAGVIAAKGNNGIGVAGILWNAKIMPVKALDQWGDGTEQDLGEGVLYAVRNGAKVVVLSVGLHRYSPYMQDIVNYAENHGVLLVAAAGNDGVTLGSKAAVKYPAAYPTVLAVGGVKDDGVPDPRSNPGPELDLLAPWNVYTTGVGGTYKKEEGSSMAAPQVAAAAALLIAQHPDFQPYQIRELLRQTAKDIGPKGVDSTSGYGILQLDQAVVGTLSKDAHEPNNSIGAATTFPLMSQMIAELDSAKDQDWYVIDVPYDGKLTIYYRGMPESGQAVPVVRFTHYADGKQQSGTDTKLSTKTMDFDVKKGKQYIQVRYGSPEERKSLPYSLMSSFTMSPDQYEPNDRMANAFKLQAKSQTVTGSFHQTADRDWFAVTFKEDGKLQLTLEGSTARMDLGLSIQREGGSLTLYDENGEGMNEWTPVMSVTPGTYYIRVHNAISLEASPTVGTYKLRLDYKPELTDPNEPNDKSYEAPLMNAGTEYKGVIHSTTDIDWFQFRIASSSIVRMNVADVPADASLKLEAYDKRMTRIALGSTGTTGKLQTQEQMLQPGVYYVKLTSSKAFTSQYYRLSFQAEELVSGFRDIKGHWAREEIISMASSGIVNGVGNYRFQPERNITRAEAVAMIVKAYKPLAGNVAAKSFSDVSSSHWASDAIRKAVQQGWVNGFPDGTFKPDRPITRAEMAVMIGHAEGIAARIPTSRPFRDVSQYEWYSAMLYAMKLEGKLKGVEPNIFKPDEGASRAQFTVLLYRYYKD